MKELDKYQLDKKGLYLDHPEGKFRPIDLHNGKLVSVTTGHLQKTDQFRNRRQMRRITRP